VINVFLIYYQNLYLIFSNTKIVWAQPLSKRSFSKNQFHIVVGGKRFCPAFGQKG